MRVMKEAIILFTRIPIPGRTKTRLMPCYTEEECAELHICFLQDILLQCKRTNRDLFVAYPPQEEESPLLVLLDGSEHLIFQKGETLEKRMQHAFQEVFDLGYDSCILIGSDIPEIQSKQLIQAFTILPETDVVMIPTTDGGYCLVGLKKMIPEVFLHTEEIARKCPSDEDPPQHSVLLNVLDHLQQKGYRSKCFDMLSDIDEPKDIVSLRERMGKNAFLKNSNTGAYLMQHRKISVIIPVYNEEAAVPLIQKELKKMPGCEILFVDGGSTDETVNKLLPFGKVLVSEKGRAKQMNMGALVSNGDVLFFLHADSMLPIDPAAEILHVLQRFRWGCFGIKFQSEGIIMRICGILSNQRVRRQKIIFGDQGIFIDRILFFDIGMFEDIPLMEDYQLSLSLKKKRIMPGMTLHRICTSGRRFAGGWLDKLRLMRDMNRLRKMYREGAEAELLTAFYPDVR